MRYCFDHDYHLHTHLSLCSNDPAQNPERLLRYAEESGLKEICITDHFWDESVPGASEWYQKQDYAHITADQPLPQGDSARLRFGCETDLDRKGVLGVAPEHYDRFDFLLIPTTHLHMRRFTINESDQPSVKRRARLWVSRLDTVLNMDLPFRKVGIAHLACGLLVPWDREEFLDCMQMIPDAAMEDLFAKAASLGVGIELNGADMNFSDGEAEIILRPFRIAKKQGCKFFCGSDSHHEAGLLHAKAVFERAIDWLDLKESDKFRLAD